MSIKKILYLLISISVTASAFAQEKPIPMDPDVRIGKLPNGFTYYIRHNEQPKKRVVMYLANEVGSVLEDDDQQGLAHFMEHMNFNGLKHYPHNELVDYLQKNGVRFGADINAYTSFDETVFQLPLPTDDPDVLNNGFQILRDWAQDALLDSTEIDKERGVVLEEKRLGKGATERMRRQYWPIILNNSRYAVRIPIGQDSVLEYFKPATIRRFYNDWYRPDLQAIIVVGDINVDQIEKNIKAKFGDLKNPGNERLRPKYTVPLTGKNQFIAVTDKEQTSTTLEVLIKQPEQPVQTTADFRENLVKVLYNAMMSERFAEILRQASPPFLKGDAGISNFMGGLADFDASVVAKPGELETGFKAVWREIERAKRFGFTSTEMERMKQQILNNVQTRLKEENKTSSETYVKAYLQSFLHNTPSPGIDYESVLIKQDLAGISLNDINLLAKNEVRDTNRDILIMAPEKDKAILPNEATVNNWLKEIDNETLLPYEDKTSSRPLLVITPVAGKIVTEQQNKELNITTITLSNGVKVLLKPTDFKNDQIMFSAFAPGGTSTYSDADYQSAANASVIIAASGVGNYNAGELSKFIQDKQVSVKPYITDRYEGINGSSTTKDLETALQLVYALFTEPRKDTTLFKGIISRTKSNLVNRANDPISVFNDTVSAILSNYNVRRTGPTLQKLEQIDLDKAFAVYKERFADAANFTFTFVGSIDTNTIKPLLEKYLGSLPATNKHEQAKYLGIHPPAGKVEKTVYKGTEPKASVILVFSGTYDYSPQNNIKFEALKETLEIRLLERLREDESGVYSPGVTLGTTKYPKQWYSFEIHFGCAPQNVDKLIASAFEEVSKLRNDGPLQENVDKWRAEDKASMQTESKTNIFWLKYLNAQLENQEPLTQLNDHERVVSMVTPDNLKTLAKHYLSEKNNIRLVLLPEKNN